MKMHPKNKSNDLMQDKKINLLVQDRRWIKHWAGTFGILYDTLLGEHNTALINKDLSLKLHGAIYIQKKGYTFAYFDQDDYDNFGKALCEKVVADNSIAIFWSDNFVKYTDEIVSFIKEKLTKKITKKDYQTYVKLFNSYSSYHRAVKVVADFLPKELKEKFMPAFSKARVHAEPVYDFTEEFDKHLLKQLSEEHKKDYESYLGIASKDILKYFNTKKLPSLKELKARYELSAYVFSEGKYVIVTGDKVNALEQSLANAYDAKIVKGRSAFLGKATGRVRIIYDPKQPGDFKEGDILVTGMTRPEFLQLMQKAAAFVTDAGGTLCHAAIVARELKKPCIIGTEVATKVLKDGMIVEVDANTGIVKVLSK